MPSMCGGWTASGTTTIGSNVSGEHVLSIALLILGIVFHHRFYDVFNETILIYEKYHSKFRYNLEDFMNAKTVKTKQMRMKFLLGPVTSTRWCMGTNTLI